MYRKRFNIHSLFSCAVLLAILLSSCHEQVSPATIATLTASQKSLERSNNDLDRVCIRLTKMLQAERKNDLEKMDMLLSMDSLVNVYSTPLDTLLIQLIDEIDYSEKLPEEYISNDFMRKIENGELLHRKLGFVKSAANALTAKFPLVDTIPIDHDIINGKPVYLELFTHTVSKIEAVTMLTVLRNNIKSTRAMLLSRLVKEIDGEVWFTKDKLFINCNYSHFKIGDTLLASFGIGEIGYMNLYDVYVDGKLIPQTKQKMLRPVVPLRAKDPIIEIEATNTIYTEIIRKPGRYVRPILVQIPTRSGGTNEIRDSLVYTVDP